MIAGLETPTEGQIKIGDRVVFDSKAGINVPPNKRRVGFLFQNYALWPNMTVYQNIAFGLENLRLDVLDPNGKPTGKERKMTKKEIEERVHVCARKVRIERFLDRYPAELSGGQQQRVAIARTLAPEPQVLFMDEPLSNLDAKLRLEMRYELQRLHVETGSTFVYVTHDQMEAMTLATRICLISNGVLQQYAEPLTVYNRPANLFVADFVGNPSMNFVEAAGSQNADGTLKLSMLGGINARFVPGKKFDLGEWQKSRNKEAEERINNERKRLSSIGVNEKANKDEVFRPQIQRVDLEENEVNRSDFTDDDFVIGIRPEAIKIDDKGAIETSVYGAMPTGMESTLKLRTGDYLLTSVVFGGVAFTIGEKQRISIESNDILLYDRISGRLICSGKLDIE
jgi:ABC-type sugar transport system ATPase subunit